MKTTRKFWNFVQQHLEIIHKKPAKNWKKTWINNTLLRKVNEKVSDICKRNKKKAALIKIVPGQLIELSEGIVRRTMINKEKEGRQTTREIFAIYLGYDSYEDCIAKENLYGTDNQKITDSIAPILKKYYREDFLFNTIRIAGDRDGFMGELSMKDYYIALSYIDYKD